MWASPAYQSAIPENAVEFFTAVRSPEVRAIATAAIEQFQRDCEAGLRPLAKIRVEPIEVGFLLHECLHPRHRGLVERTVLLDELLEGTVVDKLLRRRHEIAHIGSSPALVQALRPGLEGELELEVPDIGQMNRHAHDGIIGNAAGFAQFLGQIDHRMAAKLPKLLLRVLGIGFHPRHVVLPVASQAKDEAQKFHARIDYHPQRVQ